MRLSVLALVAFVPSLGRADALDQLLQLEAAKALTRDDVALVLPWVPPAAAETARSAFEQARNVCAPSRDVAVAYLAATLRRLREEEPPAPAASPDRVKVERALTRALARRSSAPIRELVSGLARARLDRAIADVRRLAEYESGDLAGARLYLRAYAALAGYVGRLAAAAAGPVAEAVAGAPPLREQICACDCPDCEEEACPPCACVCIGPETEAECPPPAEVTWR
jgi:hypothetical protein